MSTKQKRLDYIDETKGVAILCITFLHFESGVIPAWLNTWIGLFMIAAFYVTSGWIMGIKDKPMKPNELLRKRIKQLGIPYLWFSLLLIAFDIIWIMLGQMDFEILLRDIYKTLTLRGIGTLWFLPVLVFGEYIFTIVKNCRNKWLWGALALIIAISVNYIYNTYWLPLRECSELNKIIDSPMQPIVRGLDAWPIIGIGYMLGKRFGNYLHKTNKALTAMISTIIFAISFVLVICPPFHIYYLNGVLCNTLPALAFMCLFTAVPKNHITGFFKYWGVNSLVLMCTHFSITQVLLMYFDKEVLCHPAFEGPRTIVYFIIAVLLTYPLVRLFNGKLKFMIGK